MVDLTLEPYACVQHWDLPGAAGHWEEILAGYLHAVAQGCTATEPAVIGHIKALALFPAGRYLRVSAVAADLPATLDGAAPADCAALDLTLNVLVYGPARGRIERITWECARAIADRWGGTVTRRGASLPRRL